MKKSDTSSQSGRALERVLLGDGLFLCAALLSASVVWQLSGRLRDALWSVSARSGNLVGTGAV
jgi:hypothetical protein